MRLLSAGAATVLNIFLSDPNRSQYGYELMQRTNLKSGSLYPILGRFEKLGWIVGSLEPSESGRPPRRVYRVEPGGLAAATTALDRFFEHNEIPAPRRVDWSM